jgi:radical SAM superfamily enzyme YgiQ (UPF0313 family)
MGPSAPPTNRSGATRVLLAYKSGRPGAGDYFARMMPVGLGYIQATLREDGVESSLANLSRVSWPRVQALLERERPDILGITMYTFNRHASLRLASMARRVNPRCVVVAGGPHATHVGRSLLRACPDLSAVALGEGELTMRDLVRAVGEGRPLAGVPGLLVRDEAGDPAPTAPRPVAPVLDALPWPGRHYAGHHLDVPQETSFLITSRGCPARCTFCNTPDFWGTRMRFRTPGHMLEEIRWLRDGLGSLTFNIRDDTFTVNKRRVVEFCERLVEQRLDVRWSCQSRVNAIDEERLAWMRRAGCEYIQYGIESGSRRLLELLAKDITREEIRAAAAATRRVGMGLSIYLISGVPGETAQDLRETAALLLGILPHDGIVAPLAVFPGTHLYEQMKRDGAMRDEDWLTEKRHTIYAMPGKAGRRSFERLVRLCARAGRAARYTRADLDAHKRRLPDAFPAWLASAEAHEAAGAPGPALEEYSGMLDRWPGHVWALLGAGRLLLSSGDREGAILFLDQAVAAVPRSAVAARARAAAGRGSPRGREARA